MSYNLSSWRLLLEASCATILEFSKYFYPTAKEKGYVLTYRETDNWVS